MIKVTLKYGLTRQIEVDCAADTTVGDLIGNSNHLAILGAPESVSGVVNGVTVSPDHYVQNGDVILLEKQAAKKATA